MSNPITNDNAGEWFGPGDDEQDVNPDGWRTDLPDFPTSSIPVLRATLRLSDSPGEDVLIQELTGVDAVTVSNLDDQRVTLEAMLAYESGFTASMELSAANARSLAKELLWAALSVDGAAESAAGRHDVNDPDRGGWRHDITGPAGEPALTRAEAQRLVAIPRRRRRCLCVHQAQLLVTAAREARQQALAIDAALSGKVDLDFDLDAGFFLIRPRDDS